MGHTHQAPSLQCLLMQATLCSRWFRQIQTACTTCSLGGPGQYTSKASCTVLSDLQYVHWHAGLLHERGACGELEKLARLNHGQLSSTTKPTCQLSEVQHVLVQGYCMKQALLMNPDSMRDLLMGTTHQSSIGTGHTSFTSRRDWQSVTVSHSCSTQTLQASF